MSSMTAQREKLEQSYKKDVEQLANRKSDLDKQLDIMQMKYKVLHLYTVYLHRDRSIDGAIPFIICMLIVIPGTNGGVFSQEKPSARRTTRQEAAVTQTVVIPLTVVLLVLL